MIDHEVPGCLGILWRLALYVVFLSLLMPAGAILLYYWVWIGEDLVRELGMRMR